MADLQYAIVIAKLSEEDGGGYGAFVPDLYGCMGDGATEQEALSDVHNAIAEWLSEAKRLNRPIPAPGSGNADAREKERELVELIREQDDLIKAQAAQVSRLTAVISEIRSVVEQRSEREKHPTPWGFLPAIAAKLREPKLPH